MDPDLDPPPPIGWLVITEIPVPGVQLGRPQLALPEPGDPVIGLTTTEDGDW